MDVVGSAASILALAQTVVSICIKVRATYTSKAGFDTTFSEAILNTEVQIQRLISWGMVFQAEACSPPLQDLLDRVLKNVEIEVKTIGDYVQKYTPGTDSLLSSISASEALDVSSLPAQPAPKQIQVADPETPPFKSKGPSLIKRFSFVISDKDGYVYKIRYDGRLKI
jgi:hypothetical protein